MSAVLAVAAVLLDWLLGEPRKWHPLVLFGRLANAIEAHLYGGADVSAWRRRINGAVALALATLPLTALAWLLASLPYVGLPLSLLMLYFSIGHKSLHQHADPIAIALGNDDVDEARRLAGRIVSRDAATLDVVPATIESVLENGNDAVFASLFWFALGGPPGAILYRLVNTLDAMWGYRNERYLQFGRAAAVCDDVMNYLPARLTALTYALLGRTRQALECWKTQAPEWESPNAGPVMAAGAGALGIRLGGPARYQGQWRQRPPLGIEQTPQPQDINRSLRLVSHGMWLWLALFLIAVGLFHA